MERSKALVAATSCWKGTDASVHYIYYTPEMNAARNTGGLKCERLPLEATLAGA